MVDCTVWWTNPLTDSERFCQLLNPDEAARYAAYRQESDRCRFLTGRALAKSVLAARLDLPVEQVDFDATCTDCAKQHGPPQLPGSGLWLSLSHSGDRVGLAVTDAAPLGLDVEATNRRVDDALLSYVLGDTELAAVRTLAEQERDRAFFTYWTRKEAVMKATGRGLKIALRGITLSGAEDEPRLVSATDPALHPDETRLADLTAGEGYSAAVAVLGAAETLTVREFWWDEHCWASARTPTP